MKTAVKAVLPAAACVLMHCATVQSVWPDRVELAGNIAVPALFGNHMVLQQKQPIAVWGWADSGGKVIVRFDGQNEEARVDESGQWSVTLQPHQSGGPFEMIILGENIIRFSDIYVGEVWICSGQSNMEWTLSQSENGEQAISESDFPAMRMLRVDHNVSFQPLKNIGTAGWQVCSPATVPDFSGVGYFFGRMLYEKLNVPVGLIQTTWGGTVAEAWTSESGLAGFPEFSEAIRTMNAQWHYESSFEEQSQNYEKAQQDWIDSVSALDEGWSEKGLGWANPGMIADDWLIASLPGLWEGTEIGDYDGIVWYRKTVFVPDSLANDRWILSLGLIDDIDITWVNGIRVGSINIYNRLRQYEIPADVIHAGYNVIVVRVLDHHGGGGVWGAENQMSLTGDGRHVLPLAGEWLYKIGVPKENVPPVPPEVVGIENSPTVLFNAMVHPLIPYTMQGVIWYQGESNADRAYQYRTLFPALIEDWRTRWNREFPFYFVQLANYMAVVKEPGESEWAELREAQTKALSLPNTGMAVIIDIGEATDIHPRNKQEVGKRLALNALVSTYHQNLIPSGPLYQSMRIENKGIRLFFDHTDGGLMIKGGQTLNGFSIAGPDRKFVWGDAVIDGETVIVRSASVKNPVAVRYAWANNPICNLYNGAGLPASPFRTDDWPGLTGP
jgi:sialate O-acetylesterase